MIKQTQLFSPELDRMVQVRIYTPPGYDTEGSSYPIAYFFDGQNLFDPAEASYGMIWAVDQVLEQIDQPMIVVGLDSSPDHRTEEYTPWSFPVDLDPSLDRRGGRGKDTVRFLLDQVIPWVKQHYRTDGRQMIAGASLGGVMSLYLGSSYPEEFDWILAMSTAGWLFQEELEQQLRRIDPSLGQRYYLDSGTEESTADGFDKLYIKSNRRLSELLTKTGVKHKFYLETGGEHNEDAWRRRLPNALGWLILDQSEES